MRTPTEDATVTAPRADLVGAQAWLLRCAAAAAAALVLGMVVVVFARFGADWPAQDFRADVAARGLSVWTNNWYAGSALAGYSVLYPPLAALAGSSAVGVASVTVAAWFAARLGPARRGLPQVAFCASVLLCLMECLVIGQVPFLLGVAFGLPGLVAVRAGRSWWAAIGAAACSLASPLSGVFLVLAGVALLRTYGWRRVLPLAAGLLGSAVAAVVDSGGGPFTYRVTTLGAITIFCSVVVLLTERSDRALRDFAFAYLAISIMAFVIDNPVGANLNRVGKLVALPLAVLYLVTRRLPTWRRLGVLAAVCLAGWWSLIPASTAVQFGAHDPGRHVAYYRGLLDFLATQDPVKGRLEVPFTRTHTESYRVARSFPLARGWERQVDLGENHVLYSPLTPARYRRWLDDNAVALVATSTLGPDRGGAAETRLLQRPPGYLRPVWHDRHWRVWRVVAPTPIADGTALLTDLGPASLTVRFEAAGRSVVRVRASPMWRVTDGTATLRRTQDGWLQVDSPRAGTVTLRARMTFALLDPTNELR